MQDPGVSSKELTKAIHPKPSTADPTKFGSNKPQHSQKQRVSLGSKPYSHEGSPTGDPPGGISHRRSPRKELNLALTSVGLQKMAKEKTGSPLRLPAHNCLSLSSEMTRPLIIIRFTLSRLVKYCSRIGWTLGCSACSEFRLGVASGRNDALLLGN